MSKQSPSASTDKKPADQAQADTKPEAADQAPSNEELQAAKVQLARMIGGTVRVLAKKDGKTQAVDRKLTADDILSFKDYGDHAVVVTIDGRKHRVEAGR